MYDFKDKTYLITGGTSGMGLAAAKQISNGGGRVIITGLDPQRLHTARQELGIIGVRFQFLQKLVDF